MRALKAVGKTKTLFAAPLGAEEFAALIVRFFPRNTSPIAIAVSGGPDSMALALCMARWLGRRKSNAHAFVVDHGLRVNATAEAEQTKKALVTLGIKAEILRWDHPPIVSKLHEVARKARYRLLIEACQKRGINALLLAHQREDQAETILMRLAKGSGVDGLAGMKTETCIEDVRILRPLLDMPKERLIATCRAADVPYVSDPSNAAEKFARGRLRRVMPLLAEEGLTIERLLDLGARARGAKDALDHASSMLVRVATKRDDAGTIRLDLEYLRTAPREIGRRALATCLQAVHAEDYPPAYDALSRLLEALRVDRPMPTCTLHGCLVVQGKRHAAIMREYAGITEMPALRPGKSAVWDKRWRITLAETAPRGLTLRPLGNPPHALLDKLAPGLRKQIPEGRARASLPALWHGEKLALIPTLPNSSRAKRTRADFAAGWPPPFLPISN